MVLGSLLLGLLAGTYINIDMAVIICVGMITTIITPIVSPIITVGLLGVGIATTCKNVIKNAFEHHVNKTKASQVDININTVAEEAADAATKEYTYFSSTMAFSALPMYLLHVLQGLSEFLLPMSIFALVFKAWTIVTIDTKSAIKYGIIGLLIASAAFITISSGSASSVFLYFLTLVSLPQALSKKSDSNPDLESTTSRTTMPLEAFLYGQSGNGAIITAMLLIQTILWGSGKDVLGTIVNGHTSMLLDPYRVGMFIIILAFVYLFNKFRSEHEINKCKQELVNNKKPNRLLGMLVNLASLGFALVTVNPLLLIVFTIGGLILNAFVDANTIRSMSVPMLLLLGVTIG